jgi:alpha-glucosidase (family GH31 glycosyl hydrolase)
VDRQAITTIWAGQGKHVAHNLTAPLGRGAFGRSNGHEALDLWGPAVLEQDVSICEKRRNLVRKIVAFLIVLFFSFWVRVGFAQHAGCQQSNMVPDALVCQDARFEVMSPTLVRMEFSSTGHFIDAPTTVIIKRDWPVVKFTTQEKDGWLTLDTGRLTLRYLMGSGRFEPNNLRVSWQADGTDHSWQPGDVDKGNLGGLLPQLDNYGVPQGINYPAPPPGLLSRNGYFFLDDSTTPTWDQNISWIEPRADMNGQDWYLFVYGHDYAHVLKEFAELSGGIPMIPRYTLGTMITDTNYFYTDKNPIVRNYHYSAQDVEALVDHFRNDGIPVDVLVLDFGWHSYGWPGGYDWSPIFPDPDAFLRWTHEHGIKVALNDHPIYMPKINDFPDQDSHAPEVRRLLSIPSNEPIHFNLADKQRAEVFMQVLHDPLIKQGVSFWWIDGGKRAAIMPGLTPDTCQGWTNRVFYDYTEDFTHQRAFIMSRYGGWGNQRYPAYFTGDTFARWPVLAYEVSSTAQGGNVLMPFTTHDIGEHNTGIYENKVVVQPPWNEWFDLNMRWIEFGVFSPLVRFHTGYENPRDGKVRIPWTYGTEGVEITRKYFRLRYRLLPYIYTYARIAYDEALPLSRPLYLEYPNLEQAYSYPGEYFFGKEMLVAPITSPSDEKDIYLPPGSWTDFFSGKVYTGDQVVHLSYAVDQIPVFVNAGAILPLAPEMEYSDQRPLDSLTLDIYGPQAGRFDLYEDDGISLGYRSGQSARTPFVFSKLADHQWKITIGPTQGHYSRQVKNRAYEIQVHGLTKPESVSLGGSVLRQGKAGQGWSWDGEASIVKINLAAATIGSEMTVTLLTKE